MKGFLFLIFLLSGIVKVEAKILRSDTIIVNNTKFLFVKYTEQSDYSDNATDTSLKVYRIENGVRHYLLKQTIYSIDADCNSVFEDFGKYEINGDSIIFRTEFSVERDKNFGLPYSQEQIYRVKDDGKLILIYDKSDMGDDTLRDNLHPN